MRSGVIVRGVHRLHRWGGTALCLLMASWFASGAVMTFTAYPAYTQAERLAHLAPLSAASVELPPALERRLAEAGLQAGGRARLVQLEGEPRWLVQDAASYRAWRARAPFEEVGLLDVRRARAQLTRAHGPCRGEVERVERPDQWTVGRTHPGSFPLLRVACEDASGLELHVSLRSGEIVQDSTRRERLLAWLGPIPHWLYPAALRRNPGTWRSGVLWLSGLGLALTLTGMIAGVHAAVRSRGRRVQRQAYLRWHQRLGLGFGVFASSWVLSGALSLEPFDWASSGADPARALREVRFPERLAPQLTAALAHCREQLGPVHELELVALGRPYALCVDARSATRIVDLTDPALAARPGIPDAWLAALAPTARLTLTREPDAYYYPTHDRPVATPYARLALPDAAHTVLYVDPARGEVLRVYDARRRLERWLFSGLHSWDFPWLYEQRTLWRTLVLGAMASGFALSVLGAAIVVRRKRRRR